MTLDAAIERLYDLNVGTTPLAEGAPHERPHKPLLLLAAFDLIDEGLATSEHIPWCQELRDRFAARFLLVRKHNDQNNPDLPFRYLAGDGFWQAFEADGKTPIRREIRVADIGQVFARFTDGFQHLAAIPENRRQMREALISRYFPNSLPIKNLSRQFIPAELGRRRIHHPQSPIHDPPPWLKNRQGMAEARHFGGSSSKSTTTNAPPAACASAFPRATTSPSSTPPTSFPSPTATTTTPPTVSPSARTTTGRWTGTSLLRVRITTGRFPRFSMPAVPPAKRNSSHLPVNPSSSRKIRLFIRMGKG